MDELDLSFEAAVVGAGPAGAMAAAVLARGGVRTVLIEKAALPRYKVCGGGLVHRGRELVRGIMPDEPTHAYEVECPTINLYNNAYRDRYSAQRSAPLATMVMRDQFDHALVQQAQAAGAHLMQGDGVTGLTLASSGGHHQISTATHRIAAHFIIAADGATSPTAKLAGWVDDRVVMPALECEVWVNDADWARLKDDARFDMDAIPHGYGWSFPKRDHLSIGVCLLQKDARDKAQLKQHYAAYLKALGIHTVLREEQHGYVIPIGMRSGPLARDGLMLVGDAAGTADPLTAEGISNALLTGQWAAEALLASRQADGAIEPHAACAAYNARIDADLRPQLNASARLSKFYYGNATVRNLLMKQFGNQLADRVADVFMGTKGYPVDVQASIWRRLKTKVSL